VSIVQRARTSGVLGVGSAVAISSLAGYALLAIVGRNLTTAEFALFMSFWGLLFGLASSMGMIEQEAARQSAAKAEEAQAPIVQIAVTAGILAAAVGAVTLLPPVSARLYGHSQGGFGLLVVVAVTGFAAQFMIRGLLIGAGDVRGYGGLVVTEALIRLVLLLAVIVTVGLTLGTAAAVVAAGAFAWIAWIPSARRILRDARARHEPRPWSMAPVRRAVSLMFGAAMTAALITGYTTMVTAFSDGAPGAAGGSIFAALTISRVPLLFVAPLQALAVPAVVRWRQDRSRTPADARRLLLRAGLATVGIAIVGAVAAWFLGPWAVRIALGSQYVVEPWAIAGLVASACFLGLLQLASAALIAFSSYRWVAVLWTSATCATALWLFLTPFDIVTATVAGALIGPVVGLAVGGSVLWRLTAQHDAAANGGL
jgi:O-antigen/teichoic acid export membrane protein